MRSDSVILKCRACIAHIFAMPEVPLVCFSRSCPFQTLYAAIHESTSSSQSPFPMNENAQSQRLPPSSDAMQEPDEVEHIFKYLRLLMKL